MCLQLSGALTAISVLRFVGTQAIFSFSYFILLQLVLLLSSVADKNLEQFATTEAIQCTEMYEFVQKLGNKEFVMPFLQV